MRMEWNGMEWNGMEWNGLGMPTRMHAHSATNANECQRMPTNAQRFMVQDTGTHSEKYSLEWVYLVNVVGTDF